MKAETINRRSRKPGFGFWLFLYALILIMLAAAGLVMFYRYMAEYEQTRPATAAKAYVDGLTADYLLAHDEAFFASLDGNIQSREEMRAFVQSVLDGMSYARSYGGQQEGLVYALESNGRVFGTFTLSETGRTNMGLTELSVTDESFDWALFCSETEATIPEGYMLSCNGAVLDDSYIVETGIHYQLLEGFYGGAVELPTMVRFQSGRYLGEVESEILDPEGKPVPDAGEDERVYTDNCTAEQKAEIKAFTDEYIGRYVQFLSSAQMAAIVGYYRVTELVVVGSDLQLRLEQAVQGLNYASSKSDEIQSITINAMMDLGNGNYVCDVTYLVETLGQADYVTTTNNARVLLQESYRGLLAAAQISY